jgi:3-isopropylmalate/(R)-2-methylmalate dehydratase small subunit
MGFPLVSCPGIRAATARGDELTVDWDTNEVRNLRSGQTLMLQPFSESERGMLDAGGLIPYLKRRVVPAS